MKSGSKFGITPLDVAAAQTVNLDIDSVPYDSNPFGLKLNIFFSFICLLNIIVLHYLLLLFTIITKILYYHYIIYYIVFIVIFIVI